MGERSLLRDMPWKRLALSGAGVSFPGWIWLKDVQEVAAVLFVSWSWRQKDKDEPGRKSSPKEELEVVKRRSCSRL